MQYNYTDTANPSEDKYRGFNYRTGMTSGVESKQSQFQLQYEIALDAINTDMSIGIENKSSKFETEPELLVDMRMSIITMFMGLIFLLKQNFQIK